MKKPNIEIKGGDLSITFDKKQSPEWKKVKKQVDKIIKNK